jgi:anti-sigma factor RsiW
MVDCRELAEVLFEFIAQELPPERQEDLRGHVAGCPACAATVESHQITLQLVRRLAPVPIPLECRARLQTAVESHLGRRSAPS